MKQLSIYLMLTDDKEGMQHHIFYTEEALEEAFIEYVTDRTDALGDSPSFEDALTYSCETGLGGDYVNPVGREDLNPVDLGLSIIPSGDWPDGDDYALKEDTAWVEVGDRVIHIATSEEANTLRLDILKIKEEIGPDLGSITATLHDEEN